MPSAAAAGPVLAPPVMPPSETMKEQVVDQVPKRIKELRFGVFSKQEILNQSVLEICERALFDLDRDRAPRTYGPLDRRLGTARKREPCETCGAQEIDCSGHFGHVRLALPAFHTGYFRTIQAILNQVCKECSHILLPEEDRRAFLRDLRRPNIDSLRKMQIARKVQERCRKTRDCAVCGAVNGAIKKVGPGPLKLVHDKYRAFNTSSSMKKEPPRSKVLFEKSFDEAKKMNGEIEKHVKKAMDDLNPLRVLKLFQRISPADCELLGMDPSVTRPEMFIWQYIPAPPVIIRPSVSQDNASTEDDITSKLSDIIHISTLIRQGLHKGSPTSQIMEQWDFLQLQIALYINSDQPGLQQSGYGKSIRGFCQRLKGKQGRFRGNLSGKRVDYSGRTVISPDPNLSIDEVAVPELVARTLTYPEKVTPYNVDKLRQRAQNGPFKYPGATNIKTKEGYKLYLKYRTPDTFKTVKVGAVVERHLEDGDIVLFNRQPSLHKLSILCHRVKVRPHRTFRLNECVCTPYNADFDGDEMNLHVPQTEEARAEAMELMGVKHNLCTPKNGEPIISAIQDFVTAAYLLSSKDVFYDRMTFTNICMSMFHANMQVDLPPPAIMKPVRLWTGKQVFNVLMRPNMQSSVLVNLDAPNRQYRSFEGQYPDLDENDAWLCIRNSEVMCGRMDKSIVGAGKKNSIFYVILRDFGPDAAVDAMNRLARLSARWLGEQGFSIGINDVYPGERLQQRKTDLIEQAYAKCDDLIIRYQRGELQKKAGCDEEMTLENDITGILNKVRGAAGDQCIEELSPRNAALVMATCGSKGSTINVSQMVAVVGQQIISGKRVEDGFQDRSLPHFPKNARQPPSKGFVQHGFFEGLSPSEFIFHAMSGREGLVDTAVKTAETGYMSRRLMKCLEDLSAQYDDTVRNSSSSIIQFKYGDDKLDPADMEDKAKPVHFARTFLHSESLTWSNNDVSMLPYNAIQRCNELLADERRKVAREHPSDEVDNVDQLESAREFLDSIEQFVRERAERQARVRKRVGLPACLELNEVRKAKKLSNEQREIQAVVDRVAKLSKKTLDTFVRACLVKYKRAQVEPGHAVGAVGAQSIGEPGTQMTLKTFHFAGVAGMSITEGVPRIKEIINASRVISTPVITCELENPYSVIAARTVKGRIEKTFLKDVTLAITERWASDSCTIDIELNQATIDALQLSITPESVRMVLHQQKRLKLDLHEIVIVRGRGKKNTRVEIDVHELDVSGKASSAAPAGVGSGARGRTGPTPAELHPRVTALMRSLPDVVIGGYPECARAVIAKEAGSERHRVLVEGYGLKACLATGGVAARHTTTNSVLETRDVLGVEAARASIVAEMAAVLRDMDIDPRHLALLADVMTQRGEVLGITRFGLARMRDSVLQLASFEKTTDHLFDAAAQGRADRIEGVSECVILGQSIALGTGAFGLVRALNVDPRDLRPRPTVFENTWETLQRGRRKDVLSV